VTALAFVRQDAVNCLLRRAGRRSGRDELGLALKEGRDVGQQPGVAVGNRREAGRSARDSVPQLAEGVEARG